MTKLTTHVLDIYSGKPGSGIAVDLFYINNNERIKINSLKLNSDGRSEKPLVEGEKFLEGKYELVFYVGEYFNKINNSDKIPFLHSKLLSYRNDTFLNIQSKFHEVNRSNN